MVPFYERREPRHVSTFFLLVFFSVSIFQRVKREREEKKREERELFFLGFGSSSPLFHKKYKKFCQHKTSSVCALKSRTWHTIRRNARRLFSFPRHSSFVLYVFVLMFLCARIYCSFLLSFYSSRPALSFFQQRGQKNQKISSSHFFGKKERKKEREKERRKKRRERERTTDTIFFFFFPLSKPLPLSLILSLGPTLDDEPRVIPHQRIQNFVKALTMHARALARNIIAIGSRERFQRVVQTMRNPKHFGNTGGSIFKFFGFRVRIKEAPGNAIKRAQRFKNCLGEVVSSYKRKEKWTTKRVKRTRPLGARALAMGILILVLITAR